MKKTLLSKRTLGLKLSIEAYCGCSCAADGAARSMTMQLTSQFMR